MQMAKSQFFKYFLFAYVCFFIQIMVDLLVYTYYNNNCSIKLLIFL